MKYHLKAAFTSKHLPCPPLGVYPSREACEAALQTWLTNHGVLANSYVMGARVTIESEAGEVVWRAVPLNFYDGRPKGFCGTDIP